MAEGPARLLSNGGTQAHRHSRSGSFARGLPCSCSLVGEKPGGLELFSRFMVWELKGGVLRATPQQELVDRSHSDRPLDSTAPP